MRIAEKLWIMALDDSRGVPRLSGVRSAISAGLLLDLDAARLIEWCDDDSIAVLAISPTGQPLVDWALEKLRTLSVGDESRFAMNVLLPEIWVRVGQSLTDANLVTRHTSRWRRERFHLVRPETRLDVVDEARAALFDPTPGADDPVLAVLSAFSVGEELLSRTPLTDFEVAREFGSRPDDGPLDRKVWECAKYTAIRWVASTGGSPAGP